MVYSVGIIGCGKLGTVLASAFSDMSFLSWVVDKAEVEKASLGKKVKFYERIEQIESLADAIFITANDENIKSAAKELAEAFGEKLKDKNVIHCSGALPLEILDSCKAEGARTYALHPYQTFYYPKKRNLEGVGWSLRTEDEPEKVESLVKALGGNCYRLKNDRATSALYHASAVAVSNITTAIISLGEEIARLAGIPPEEFIPKILETTCRNNIKAIREGEPMPLTGPLARGDVKAIEEHLNALKGSPVVLSAYRQAALAALETAKRRNIIGEEKYREIKDLLG